MEPDFVSVHLFCDLEFWMSFGEYETRKLNWILAGPAYFELDMVCFPV